MTRKETTITFEISIHKDGCEAQSITHKEARLNLDHRTKLNDIAQFEKKAKALVKTAKKHTKEGDFVFVDITRATYLIPDDIGHIKTEKFEMWSGYGASITDEGIHLTPSEQYNENQEHDLWITGKNILEELTL